MEKDIEKEIEEVEKQKENVVEKNEEVDLDKFTVINLKWRDKKRFISFGRKGQTDAELLIQLMDEAEAYRKQQE